MSSKKHVAVNDEDDDDDEEDEDYCPPGEEESDEPESDNDGDEALELPKKKNAGGKRKNDVDSTDDEEEVDGITSASGSKVKKLVEIEVNDEVKKEAEKKKVDDIWSSFLKDVNSKPKSATTTTPIISAPVNKYQAYSTSASSGGVTSVADNHQSLEYKKPNTSLNGIFEASNSKKTETTSEMPIKTDDTAKNNIEKSNLVEKK